MTLTSRWVGMILSMNNKHAETPDKLENDVE